TARRAPAPANRTRAGRASTRRTYSSGRAPCCTGDRLTSEHLALEAERLVRETRELGLLRGERRERFARQVVARALAEEHEQVAGRPPHGARHARCRARLTVLLHAA